MYMKITDAEKSLSWIMKSEAYKNAHNVPILPLAVS